MVKRSVFALAAVMALAAGFAASPRAPRALRAQSAQSAQSAADQFKAGRALLDSSKADAAVKAFEKAVALDDKNPEYHLWLGNAVGAVARNASVLRQPFLARRVKAEFERAVELDPQSVSAREGLVTYYVQAPGVMGGSMMKAREEAEAIAKINPMRGHFSRATIAGSQKDFVTVDRELRAALADDPDSVVATTSLANYLAGQKHGEEAFALIDKYLARHPGDVLATFWIGRLAAMTGLQLERGEKALRDVLATPNLGGAPNQPAPYAVHFRLGDILAKRGDKAGARGEYEKSLELNARYEPAKRALKGM
jgi:tetratricopeptide (TPR) repeat protein